MNLNLVLKILIIALHSQNVFSDSCNTSPCPNPNDKRPNPNDKRPNPYPYPQPRIPQRKYDPMVCEFESNNNCGYVSQQNLIPFELHQNYPNISAEGLMVWKWIQTNQSCVNGGRLMSHPYPTHQFLQVFQSINQFVNQFISFCFIND